NGEQRYRRLTCNELLRGPLMEPRNLIVMRSQKPCKLRRAERCGDSCKLHCQNEMRGNPTPAISRRQHIAFRAYELRFGPSLDCQDLIFHAFEGDPIDSFE